MKQWLKTTQFLELSKPAQIRWVNWYHKTYGGLVDTDDVIIYDYTFDEFVPAKNTLPAYVYRLEDINQCMPNVGSLIDLLGENWWASLFRSVPDG